MLELMNAVLTDRSRRETVGKANANRKKRDKKFKQKQKGLMSNIDNKSSSNPEDDRPIGQQILNPKAGVFGGETSIVAIDCEMVEVDRWGEGLARVSIVNYHGVVLMDKFVIPEGDMITNYRTWVSGVTPNMLKTENGAIHFKEAK